MWWAVDEPAYHQQQCAALFLGDGIEKRRSSGSGTPPVSPTSRRPQKKPPGTQQQKPVLLCSVRRPPERLGATDPGLFYFEVFIKTTGGGLSPNGGVGVGLVDEVEPAAEAPRRYLHYHNALGRRFDVFPRPTAKGAGRSCGPSFGVGDTVGCGWLLRTGELFFTLNGRHLGICGADVRGALCPAVDCDTPGACLELSYGGSGERALRYRGDGTPPILSERFLQRLLPGRAQGGERPPAGSSLGARMSSFGAAAAKAAAGAAATLSSDLDQAVGSAENPKDRLDLDSLRAQVIARLDGASPQPSEPSAEPAERPPAAAPAVASRGRSSSSGAAGGGSAERLTAAPTHRRSGSGGLSPAPLLEAMLAAASGSSRDSRAPRDSRSESSWKLTRDGASPSFGGSRPASPEPPGLAEASFDCDAAEEACTLFATLVIRTAPALAHRLSGRGAGRSRENSGRRGNSGRDRSKSGDDVRSPERSGRAVERTTSAERTSAERRLEKMSSTGAELLDSVVRKLASSGSEAGAVARSIHEAMSPPSSVGEGSVRGEARPSTPHRLGSPESSVKALVPVGKTPSQWRLPMPPRLRLTPSGFSVASSDREAMDATPEPSEPASSELALVDEVGRRVEALKLQIQRRIEARLEPGGEGGEPGDAHESFGRSGAFSPSAPSSPSVAPSEPQTLSRHTSRQTSHEASPKTSPALSPAQPPSAAGPSALGPPTMGGDPAGGWMLPVAQEQRPPAMLPAGAQPPLSPEVAAALMGHTPTSPDLHRHATSDDEDEWHEPEVPHRTSSWERLAREEEARETSWRERERDLGETADLSAQALPPPRAPPPAPLPGAGRAPRAILRVAVAVGASPAEGSFAEPYLPAANAPPSLPSAYQPRATEPSSSDLAEWPQHQDEDEVRRERARRAVTHA